MPPIIRSPIGRFEIPRCQPRERIIRRSATDPAFSTPATTGMSARRITASWGAVDDNGFQPAAEYVKARDENNGLAYLKSR
jgi:hypothetical protein